jgi:sodium-dependent dicarboxylate transporter 2/3/5
MRTSGGAGGGSAPGPRPADAYTAAEERFNRRRRALGLVLGPVLFVALLAAPMMQATPAPHRLAAILALVVVFWITEALPVPVTALLGPTLAVVLRVAPAKQALAPFGDPIIFLFIGSFILAQAMYTHGLDRRIAYTALASRWVGSSAGRIMVTYGAVSLALSMWISNTATAAMLLPIGVSIIAHIGRNPAIDPRAFRRFSLALMLITAFGASIGGIATPIGTPPNLIGLGMLRSLAHTDISFFRWMGLGLPLSLAIFAVMATGFWAVGARRIVLADDSTELVREGLKALGRTTRGERNVLLAFGVTVTLWILPGLLAIAGVGGSAFARGYHAAVPEAIAALTGAILLFLLPVDWRERRFTITWDQAVRIDWGTILLFGGGLSLGTLAFSTGLAESMGRGITAWLPSHTPLAFTMLFTALGILMSETTSNTAAASMIVPIVIAVCEAAGVRPVEPALGATLGASMAFMLPVSTPPNAIVYSSGHVPITAMISHGVWLDVVAFVLIVVSVSILGPVLF